MNWKTSLTSFLPALRNSQSIETAEFQKQVRNIMDPELRQPDSYAPSSSSLDNSKNRSLSLDKIREFIVRGR